MPYETRWALRTLALNASTFTDIVGSAILPIDCNQIVVYNPASTAVNVTLASDPTNPNSQVTIPPGGQFTIGSPALQGQQAFRFPKGSFAAGSLIAASGTPNVLIESIQ